MSRMAFLRRSRRDDVDLDSFLENLHRVAAVATAPIRQIIDLRHDEEPTSDVVEVDVDTPAKR